MMKKDFNIVLPEGVKITDIQSTISENGTVATITMCMEEEYVPKNGDFVRIEGNLQDYIAIYNVSSYVNQKQNKLFFYALLGKTSDKLVINDWIFSREVFPATTDEIRKLEAALAEKGKRWNPDKKCIEDLPRWRAEKKEGYYYISGNKLEVEVSIDLYSLCDNDYYNAKNYFKTREAAEKVASQIREIFKNSKAE